jgi:hypothetical protein
MDVPQMLPEKCQVRNAISYPAAWAKYLYPSISLSPITYKARGGNTPTRERS